MKHFYGLWPYDATQATPVSWPFHPTLSIPSGLNHFPTMNLTSLNEAGWKIRHAMNHRFIILYISMHFLLEIKGYFLYYILSKCIIISLPISIATGVAGYWFPCFDWSDLCSCRCHSCSYSLGKATRAIHPILGILRGFLFPWMDLFWAPWFFDGEDGERERAQERSRASLYLAWLIVISVLCHYHPKAAQDMSQSELARLGWAIFVAFCLGLVMGELTVQVRIHNVEVLAQV